MILTGTASTREVKLNGKPLDPRESLRICNHSPDGFNWGYSGSGPAQLALAVLMEFVSIKNALKYYQEFKEEVIATLSMDEDFEIKMNMQEWLNTKIY